MHQHQPCFLSCFLLQILCLFLRIRRQAVQGQPSYLGPHSWPAISTDTLLGQLPIVTRSSEVLYPGLHAGPRSHLLCGGPGLDSPFYFPVWWFLALLTLSGALSGALSHVQDLACCPQLLGCLPHPLSFSLGHSPSSRALAPQAADAHRLKNTEKPQPSWPRKL